MTELAGTATVSINKDQGRPFQLILPHKHRKKGRHHSRKRIAFFNYTYYDIVFQFFTEHVLDAEYVPLDPPTKRSLEIGEANSTDFVCTPFKHILGGYIEALEKGADLIVQFAGPCRLGYYGELHEAILKDLGYDFEVLNFSHLSGKPAIDYVKACKKVNPKLSIPVGLKNFLALLKMVEGLDEANDYYLANAGFEREPGSFRRVLDAYHDDLRLACCERDILATQHAGMELLRRIPLDKPLTPLRVGIVGEYYTAVDPASNLYLEQKLLDMSVELHRQMNITNRNLRYNEPNLRAGSSRYLRYDMGPTSTLTISAAHRYAQEGFDGIIHLKSAGCTPEIDCMPVLQRIGRDYDVPVLFLSFDSQTSDTGLATRLEAFYDMISRRRLVS